MPLCKATQEPTSQLAALLRVAQIVHILSAADPITTSEHSMVASIGQIGSSSERLAVPRQPYESLPGLPD